jgi:hypothetical protein
MIKTGKRLCFLTALVFSFALTISGFAQDITVSAALTETNIFAGEPVRLDVKVSGQSINSVRQPVIPSVDGLRWLSNNTSTSQSFSYVNGRPAVSYTYGYSFIAQTPGEYTFPALSLTVNGDRYETTELTFKILDPRTVDTGEAERSPDIYVRLEPSTTDPVVGEQVIADIVLYFKDAIEVSSYQPSPGWKAEGFWKEELENRQRAQTTSTIINGVRYQRARLLQYAIFPTKSGELELSPFDISVQVRNRNRRRDFFGFGQERMELSTLPVTIDVDPLPPLDNATFSGAVGSFNITRSMNPQNAYVGESIEVVTTIRGQGNIPLIVKPEYEYPETLELYNPQENTTITRTNRQIGGTKIFTDILIARNEGTFEIPEARLAVYNPVRDRYSTTVLPALNIEAKRDPRAVSNNSANELRFDVQPITGLANWVVVRNEALYEKPWVWILVFLPLFVLGVGFVVKQYRDRMNNDTAFARAQKAKEKATTELEQANSATDIKAGYSHIQKALIQYITDKLNLPPAGLSNERIVSELESIGATAISNDVKRMLDKCDTIAYAPNATQAGLESDIRKTEELIKSIGKLI